jgi:hypothetical protein
LGKVRIDVLQRPRHHVFKGQFAQACISRQVMWYIERA